MQRILLFLPDLNLEKIPSTLYGVIIHCETAIAVYILGNCCEYNCKYLSHYELLGEQSFRHEATSRRKNSDFWISILISSNDLKIEKISVNVDDENCQVTVIQYNKGDIKKSQLLDANHQDIQLEQTDYVSTLSHIVQNEPTVCCMERKLYSKMKLSSYFPGIWYTFLQNLVNITENSYVKCICKGSSFGCHFFNVLKTFAVMLLEISKEKYVDVRYINYIIARIFDALLGEIIIYYVLCHTSSDDLFAALIQFQEFIVTYLRNTVEWLMGSPAGFKLYCPLNNVLGIFYQFHISLWWTFLVLLNPFLKWAFNFLLFLGNFGFSFQVSILADLLAIVSVHIYCIYVYAAKLYYFQMKGLKILARLFIGKKRSPLPGNVHSSPYTTEQLLFGTVSFTILLFLLPTALVYYFVFTGIRILLIFAGGLLTRLKYFMNIFPVYLTIVRFYNPQILTCTMKLNMQADFFPDGTLVTRVEPVCETWWKTVDICIPTTIKKPDRIEWRKLTTDVLIGNLIYPV